MRPLSCVLCCALVGTIARGDEPRPAPAAGNWVTIKGSVVFPPGKELPKRAPLNVQQDKGHCLMKGAILDESVIVNPKNRAIKNVVVWLRPEDTSPAAKWKKEEIHPDDAKRKAGDVVIDQPCCMFVERVTCARVGDTIVVKNPAPVVHNFFWSSTNSGEHNANVPAKGQWRMPNTLDAEPGPVQYKCTIHPWMAGYVRVFDHPYYAVTDEDGKFEIKNAPAGKFRIVYWHETGLRGGAKGRFGEPIDVVGPTLEMKPVEFEVK
jgi:plastocyanin